MHVHIVRSSNFFIPLQGRKRFTLLPPPAQSRGLFPAHHPYYRHLRPAAVASVLAGSGTVQRAAGLREVVVGTSLSGSISTILTVPSWIRVGIHRCGALPSPVLA